MRIKTLLKFLKEIAYLRSILTRYGDSLAQGRYFLFDNFRSMSLSRADIKDKAALYFGKESGGRKADIAKKLNQLNYFCNRNKKTTGEYTAFYSANNYDKKREIKLFSFEKRKILILCTDHQEAEKQLWQYSAFGRGYRMPAVKKSDRYPNALEISMVEKKAFPGDTAALNSILEGTIAFNGPEKEWSKVTVQKLIDCSHVDPKSKGLLESLAAEIDQDVLRRTLAMCMQHGDLSKENLIYGEADGEVAFWWIDWEHAENRMFLYDFFFYIINSAMYYDTKAYESYMGGKNDDRLQEVFSHFGLTYAPENRKDYFLIFAVDFLKERVCNVGRVKALEKYCRLIEHMLEIKNED